MNGSVHPSVRPSICPSVTPFWLCSHHRIIMKFSGVITSDRSDVHAKGQGQRSKVKVTKVTTQLHRFYCFSRSSVKFQGHTALKIIEFAPDWAFPDCNSNSIHQWLRNAAQSLKWHRRGALLFLKLIRQISRSRGSKNRWIWPKLGVSEL